MKTSAYKNIVLFDGVCNLCNSSVAFILKNDKKEIFKFSSLQSEFCHNFLETSDLTKLDLSTMIYIKNRKVYYKSTAWLQILKSLGGMWCLLYFFIIVPRRIRDFLYNIIATNRYKWFGKKETCYLPNFNVRDRFI